MSRLRPEDLAIRRTGITATDVVTLAGLSPYRSASPHLVFAEKVGIAVEPLADEELEMGHELEPIVLRIAGARLGLTLVKGSTEASREIAHHIATPDALHVPSGTREALAEAKAVGIRHWRTWGQDEEGVPEHVLAQVAWQMHVTTLPLAFVGALVGTEVRTYRLERTPDVDTLIGALCEIADRFWVDHVLARKPPTLDGSEGATKMIRAAFPAPRDPMVRASPDAERAAALYFASKAAKATTEREHETAKQLLIAACGQAEGLVGDGWRLRMPARKAYSVSPKPYTVPEGRRFDMRESTELYQARYRFLERNQTE